MAIAADAAKREVQVALAGYGLLVVLSWLCGFRMSVHPYYYQLLGLDHAELSAAALAKWNLPEPIQNAMRDQFAPRRKVDGEFPLSVLIDAAERLLTVRELTIFETDSPPEVDPADVLEPFGLHEEWDELIDEFEREFEPIRAFF